MFTNKIVTISALCAVVLSTTNLAYASEVALQAGDPSLLKWRLPVPPVPKDNVPNAARVELGKHLFFDPRISGDGNMSCATCHNPALGWSDALPTAKGVNSKVLGRASPTIVNSVYNTIMMWDGRKKHLEDQATGPMQANVEMNTDFKKLFEWLPKNAGYKKMFDEAYPGEGVTLETIAKAIASYERTVVMDDTPFDRWLQGDEKAMTAQQVRGFGLFLDPNKGNCQVCHSAPNFTDNGFHNLGLASFGQEKPDLGRFEQKKLPVVKGAFKTPQLRGVALTAPYFHDGSAATLKDVIAHYNKGGVVKTNLSPNMKTLNLTDAEQEDLVAFLHALTGSTPSVTIPNLPPM